MKVWGNLPGWIRKMVLAFGIIAALLFGVAWWVSSSPRVAVRLIQWVSEAGANKTAKALIQYRPASVHSQSDQPYLYEAGRTLGLDIHRPSTASQRALPVLLWIHGGGFVAGRKEDPADYLRLIAKESVVVVSVDYTLSPEVHFPTHLTQVEAALQYVVRNARGLRIDPQQIFVGGDSAGALLAAQLATLHTNSQYAKATGIQLSGPVVSIRGVLLFCGLYDLRLMRQEGLLGWFVRSVLWAFTGSDDFNHHPAMNAASVLQYVDGQFPAAFITVGNADPLQYQSRLLDKRLRELNIETDTLFFAEDHQPALQHVYQFELGMEDARIALKRAVEFIKRPASSAQSPKNDSTTRGGIS